MSDHSDGVLVSEGAVLDVTYNSQQIFFTITSLSSDTVMNVTDHLTDSSSHMTDSFSHMAVTSPNNSLTPVKPPIITASSTPKTPSSNNNDSMLDDLVIGKITLSTKVVFVDDTKPVIKTRLSDIGGLQQQIELIQRLILLPLSSPGIIEESGVHFPHGVLIYGPSGAGKTLLAEAVAGEVPCHSEIINGFDLINDLARRLEELMEVEPSCLVIINDVDCLDNPESTLVNVLQLIHQPSCKCNMVVIATTNKIESISSRLRRPKMFGLEIEVPAPNSRERRDILGIVLKDISNSITDEEMERIASSAHGYVGMDLQVINHLRIVGICLLFVFCLFVCLFVFYLFVCLSHVCLPLICLFYRPFVVKLNKQLFLNNKVTWSHMTSTRMGGVTKCWLLTVTCAKR